MDRKKKYFYLMRNIYLCMLGIYTILREVVPLQAIIGIGLISYLFFGLGLFVIMVGLWMDRDHVTRVNIGLFIAFIAVCIISTLMNLRHEFISNIKAVGWMCLYFFLLYPCGFYQKERRNKEIIAIFTTVIITFTIVVLLSLLMYFFNIGYSYINSNLTGELATQGFHKTYLRLWGMFSDPNMAASYAIAVMSMTAYLFVKKKKLFVRILLTIVEVLLMLFVILTGSRTAILAIVIACAWLAFYATYTLIRRQRLTRVGFSTISSILAILIGYGVLAGVTHAMPYVKIGIDNVCSASFSRSVHIAYDKIYQNSGLDIVDGYFIEGENSGEATENNGGSTVRPDLDNKNDISNGRFAKWEDALELFIAAPIFGASPRGASSFGKIHCPENEISMYGAATHNFVLEVMVGTGTFGIIIVSIIFLLTAKLILKKTLKKKFDIDFLLLSTIVLTMTCSSLFISDLFFILTFGGFAFWLALGAINGNDRIIDLEQLPISKNDEKHILVYGAKNIFGGVEKVILQYVIAIRKAYKNIYFDFLCFGDKCSIEKEIEAVGCKIIYLPSRKKHYFKYKKALEDIFLKTPYSAVWGNYSGLTNIDLLVLAKKYHVPVRIAHSHGSKLDWGSMFMKYVVYFLHYYNKLWLGDYATDYWACSTVAGTFMFPKSAQKKVQIIPNAVDITKFYPDESIGANVRAELGIEKDAIVIGHVARMCEVKNQIFLLNVVAQAMQSDSKVRLLFVGDGELRENLKMETKRLNISDKVIFLGMRQDIPNLLRAMDVFVLTSFSEGLSVSAVEAQACGVPCVLPTSVSVETDIIGDTIFIPLTDSTQIWADKILQQAKIKPIQAQEKIREKGFEIYSASDQMICAFLSKA